MKMHIIGCGKMSLDRSGLLAGVSSGTADNPRAVSEWVDIPVCTYLIESPAGLVLYDTACDPDGMSKNWPRENRQVSPHTALPGETLPERLRAFGCAPEDIRHVVMSHLHTDHAGCLHLFKNAEVFVSETELMQALKLYAMRAPRPAYILSDIRHWLDAGLTWHPLPDEEREYELAPGLTVVNLGAGHTFGMLGLLVTLPNSGSFLIVSDALYTAENAGPPVRLPGLVYDSLGYEASAKYILKYAKAHDAAILFGHDTAQFDGLLKFPEGFYD